VTERTRIFGRTAGDEDAPHLLPADAAAATVELDGHEVRLTNLDRVLWPETGHTKRQMLEYLLAVAPALLPHLRGRSITLRRFPEGVDGPGWYQANCRGHPEWMAVQEVRGRRGDVLRYCVVETAAALVWVANLGTIELHPFLGTVDRPDEPTAIVVDLDPGPPAALVASARVALETREVLVAAGLDPVVKTSGSIGLHVMAPLEPGHSFVETKAAVRALAEVLARRLPDLVAPRIERRARSGRVFVDWVQNDESRSTVAPYSLRATPWPLVSTPVTWDEVEAALTAGRADLLLFPPDAVLRRLDRAGDLFAPVLTGVGRLPEIHARG
jgi:bifunctional non-homologous end joining protein LigD